MNDHLPQLVTSSVQQELVSLSGLLHQFVGTLLPNQPLPIVWQRPAVAAHGDYATSLSLALFTQLSVAQKQQYTSPRALAIAAVAFVHASRGNRAESAVATGGQADPDWSGAEGQPLALTVAGPGFINVVVNQSLLWANVVSLLDWPTGGLSCWLEERDKSGDSTSAPSKVIIEYVSPNTNKPLHIGHLRNGAIGAAVANLLEATGAEVIRAVEYNDRGLHIMKSAWAFLLGGRRNSTFATQLQSGSITPEMEDQLFELMAGNSTRVGDQSASNHSTNQSSTWLTLLAEWSANPSSWLNPALMTNDRLQKPDHFTGFFYQLADRFSEQPTVSAAWADMLQTWEDETRPGHQELRALWQQLNTWFYEGFNQTGERFGFRFDADAVTYESAIYQLGRQIILDGVSRGIFQKLPDGAVQVDLAAFKLPNKILLRRDGTSIYMSFDVELTRQRTHSGADQLIWVVGADQILYFQQLFAVAQLLGYGQQEKYFHLAHGMVRLPEGKMSSRKGRVVYADDLLDLAVARAQQLMQESSVAAHLKPEEEPAVAQALGLGAVKWTLLSVDAVSELIYDVDKSVSFTGFAGPYVQYTHARCCSILTKAPETAIAQQSDLLLASKSHLLDFPLESAEIDLLRNLLFYYEIVSRSAQARAPHLLCTYLFELCQSFNGFYASCSVLSADQDPALTQRRVVLVQAVATVLKSGLELLGIEAVERL